MSVVGGLFSDVFKSQGMTVPGSEGSIDWSKAGGNPADLNWAAIKPFEVISPMSWAQTNKDATAPEEAKAKLDSIDSTDTRSEYQKWLDGQNGKQDTSHDNKAGPSWYDTTTPEQRAQFFQENPTLGSISRAGMGLWNTMDPYGLASKQRELNPTQLDSYMAETRGWSPTDIATQQQNTVNAAVQANDEYNYTPPESSGGGGSSGTNTGAGVAESYGGFSYGDTSQGVWG
jgi:hypothetical protein